MSSSTDDEVRGPTPGVPDSWDPKRSSSGSDVVVNRRGGLVATGAIGATVIAIGYLWSFIDTGSEWSAVIGVALGLIAIGFALAWRDAKTPLLVADETGLRVRLGSAWTGVRWEQVECVEVESRGRVRDGHVAVLLPDGVDALAGAGRRSRVAAWVNHMFFETPLVTPFGLSTTVSKVDMAAALKRLAAGRADVVALDAVDDVPESTVEVLKTSAPADSAVDQSDAVHDDAPDASSRWRRLAERAALRARRSEAEGAGDVPVTVAATTSAAVAPVAPSEATAPAAVRPVVAGLESAGPEKRPVHAVAARREDVTITPGQFPPTDGGLALTPEADDVEQAVALPEIEHLRRGREVTKDDDAASGGNIGLIIDATTDLSARAMQRVRSGRPAAPESEVRVVTPRTDPPGELFGRELQEARQRLGLSVDDLADRTRIRPYVIESIEADDFAPCGGDFYARGHLRQIARTLGIDAAPLIERYDANVASSPVTPREVFEVELAAGTTGMIRGGERAPNWAALIGAVLVLLIIWGVARYFVSDSSPEAPPAETNRAGVASPGPGNPPVPDPIEAAVRITAAGGDSAVVVKDRFRNVVYKGELVDGQSKRITAESPLRVQAANGAVVELTTRGKELGPMSEEIGPAKQVVRGKR